MVVVAVVVVVGYVVLAASRLPFGYGQGFEGPPKSPLCRSQDSRAMDIVYERFMECSEKELLYDLYGAIIHKRKNVIKTTPAHCLWRKWKIGECW